MRKTTRILVSPAEFQKENLREDGSIGLEYMKILHKDFQIIANQLLNAGITDRRKRRTYIIDKRNEEFYWTVIAYFSRNRKFFDSPLLFNSEKASFDKGLILCGEHGAGKTFMFKVLNYLNTLIGLGGNNFTINFSKKIVEDFNKKGHESIQNYYLGQRYFDGIGEELEGKFFGKEEVMKLILEERGEAYANHQLKTFASTNFLEEGFARYGSKVESQVNQMFNLVYAKSTDFRKLQ